MRLVEEAKRRTAVIDLEMTPGRSDLSLTTVRFVSIAFVVLFAPVSTLAEDSGTDKSNQSEQKRQATAGQQKQEPFKKHLKKGKKHYSNKEYDRALEAFEKAYDIRQKSNLLYNMGLVAEKGGHLEKAVKYYEKFVVSPGVELDLRERVNDRLKVLRDILEQQREAENKADRRERAKKARKKMKAEGQKGRLQAADDRKDSKKPEQSGGGEVRAEAEVNEGISRKAWGYTLLGVGALSVLGSGGAYWLSRSDREEFDTASQPEARRRARDAEHRKHVTSLALGVSGAAVTGMGLYLLLTAEHKEAVKQSGLSPYVAPRRVGLAWTTSF